MPTLLVPRDELFGKIGQVFGDDEFGELCFIFGLELDDITSERIIQSKETGIDRPLSDRVLYRIEVPANRYDLLSTEGLSLALRAFLGKEIMPTYSLDPSIQEHILASPDTHPLRPFVFAAILRNVEIDEAAYESFIEFQDKLHTTAGRNRQLVSMGTHDYDSLQGPFSYEALPPSEISFVPLNQQVEINGTKLAEFYEQDRKIKKYLHLANAPRQLVILDSNKVVCSLPPIINSEHSKISTRTRNIFIEVTARDFARGELVLKTLACVFSCYCSTKYTIVPVRTIYTHPVHRGNQMISGWSLNLEPMTHTIPIDAFNRLVGVDFSPCLLESLLSRMMHSPKVSGDNMIVQVSPLRTDVLHPCDIIEDAAIAYGYDDIPKAVPQTFALGKPCYLNKLSDMLRIEVALLGYTEVISLTLCSIEENRLFSNNLEDQAIVVSNPKTQEYQEVRISLFPGLLKTLVSNQTATLPIRIFELGDVVLLDRETETGARNQRHLAMVYCGTGSAFESLHGCLDHLMRILSISRTREIEGPKQFDLCRSNCSEFVPGQCADVVYNRSKIGVMGVLHPRVTCLFGTTNVVTGLEISIEPLMA